MVTAASSPSKLFDGEGNWGTMTDPPAAYRYTNCKLSKFADLVFFDKFYLPVVTMVDNYDSSRKEPLILPTLLPNTILNGNFGITPGVQTRTPSYTLESVLRVLKVALKEGKVTPEMCLDLDFISRYGGIVVKHKEVKKELIPFYKTGKGKVTFESTASAPNEKNEIRITAFAPISSIEKILIKVSNIKGILNARDDSDKSDKYKVAYVIALNKNLKGSLRDEVVRKAMACFAADQTFSVQATDRLVDSNGVVSAKLFPTSVTGLLQLWINYRLQLERDACTYWINNVKLKLEDLALLRLAVKMRDLILKALSKNCSDDELAEYLSKKLKITLVQANRILDLKVRQLRSLEDKKLVQQIKELEAESKTYEGRRKHPDKYVLEHLDVLAKELLPPAKQVKKVKKRNK
jgi:DNA gyrase subunit A